MRCDIGTALMVGDPRSVRRTARRRGSGSSSTRTRGGACSQATRSIRTTRMVTVFVTLVALGVIASVPSASDVPWTTVVPGRRRHREEPHGRAPDLRARRREAGGEPEAGSLGAAAREARARWSRHQSAEFLRPHMHRRPGDVAVRLLDRELIGPKCNLSGRGVRPWSYEESANVRDGARGASGG